LKQLRNLEIEWETIDKYVGIRKPNLSWNPSRRWISYHS